MLTPVILYTTAGMPIGAFASIAMYRVTPASVTINGTAYQVATAPATGGLAAGSASLGNYLCERLNLNTAGKLVSRMGAIGEDSDDALIRQKPTLTGVFQAAGNGTPSLMPGDAFEAQIGFAPTSTVAVPVLVALSRWFIDKNGINYDAGDPTKFSATFILDRQNSSATLNAF